VIRYRKKGARCRSADHWHVIQIARTLQHSVAQLFHGELWPPMSTMLSTVN